MFLRNINGKLDEWCNLEQQIRNVLSDFLTAKAISNSDKEYREVKRPGGREENWKALQSKFSLAQLASTNGNCRTYMYYTHLSYTYTCLHVRVVNRARVWHLCANDYKHPERLLK